MPRARSGWFDILFVIAVLAVPTLGLIALGEAVPSWLGAIIGLATLPAAALASRLLMRRSGDGAGGLGLHRPRSAMATLGLGVASGLGVLLVAVVVITPVTTWLFGSRLDPEMFDPLRGDVAALLMNVLLISWLHAALCEEIVFRGFLFQRIEQVLGGGAGALATAGLVQGVLFGLSHYPQGGCSCWCSWGSIDSCCPGEAGVGMTSERTRNEPETNTKLMLRATSEPPRPSGPPDSRTCSISGWL